MPTGYTACIEKGIEFNDFVMQCARGMGALIMMRDEPHDAPIPEKFEPSDYHEKKLVELHAERDRLSGLTDEQAQQEFRDWDMEQFKSRAKYNKEKDSLKAAYKAMLAKVEAWRAPTKEHEGLKKFMVDQIEQSIDFDCNYDLSNITGPSSWEEWIADKKAGNKRDIFYHETEQEKEIERTNSRNRWIRQLRESLNA